MKEAAAELQRLTPEELRQTKKEAAARQRQERMRRLHEALHDEALSDVRRPSCLPLPPRPLPLHVPELSLPSTFSSLFPSRRFPSCSFPPFSSPTPAFLTPPSASSSLFPSRRFPSCSFPPFSSPTPAFLTPPSLSPRSSMSPCLLPRFLVLARSTHRTPKQTPLRSSCPPPPSASPRAVSSLNLLFSLSVPPLPLLLSFLPCSSRTPALLSLSSLPPPSYISPCLLMRLLLLARSTHRTPKQPPLRSSCPPLRVSAFLDPALLPTSLDRSLLGGRSVTPATLSPAFHFVPHPGDAPEGVGGAEGPAAAGEAA